MYPEKIIGQAAGFRFRLRKQGPIQGTLKNLALHPCFNAFLY